MQEEEAAAAAAAALAQLQKRLAQWNEGVINRAELIDALKLALATFERASERRKG